MYLEYVFSITEPHTLTYFAHYNKIIQQVCVGATDGIKLKCGKEHRL